jgi:hypothetical protein
MTNCVRLAAEVGLRHLQMRGRTRASGSVRAMLSPLRLADSDCQSQITPRRLENVVNNIHFQKAIVGRLRLVQLA